MNTSDVAMQGGWVGMHQTDPDSNNLDVAMQGIGWVLWQLTLIHV